MLNLEKLTLNNDPVCDPGNKRIGLLGFDQELKTKKQQQQKQNLRLT